MSPKQIIGKVFARCKIEKDIAKRKWLLVLLHNQSFSFSPKDLQWEFLARSPCDGWMFSQPFARFFPHHVLCHAPVLQGPVFSWERFVGSGAGFSSIETQQCGQWSKIVLFLQKFDVTEGVFACGLKHTAELSRLLAEQTSMVPRGFLGLNSNLTFSGKIEGKALD